MQSGMERCILPMQSGQAGLCMAVSPGKLSISVLPCIDSLLSLAAFSGSGFLWQSLSLAVKHLALLSLTMFSVLSLAVVFSGNAFSGSAFSASAFSGLGNLALQVPSGSPCVQSGMECGILQMQSVQASLCMAVSLG